MKIERLNFSFDFPDEWIEELSLPIISSTEENYLCEPSPNVFLVNISEIKPDIRRNGVSIFGDKEKTFDILRGFVRGDSIPPIEVVDYDCNNQYRYELTDGCKRLHCSILVGFTKIPVVYGHRFVQLEDCKII